VIRLIVPWIDAISFCFSAKGILSALSYLKASMA